MRYLILIIILLLIFAWWPEQPTPTAEESFIGDEIKVLNKAEQFSEDYEKSLDDYRDQIDAGADGGP